jgi:hypothetical protein
LDAKGDGDAASSVADGFCSSSPLGVGVEEGEGYRSKRRANNVRLGGFSDGNELSCPVPSADAGLDGSDVKWSPIPATGNPAQLNVDDNDFQQQT